MCGRYSLTGPNPGQVRERFALGDDVPVEQRFNVAPGTGRRRRDDRSRRAPRAATCCAGGSCRTGPTSPKVGYKMINARAETLTERPAFRDAFATPPLPDRRRRLLRVAAARARSQAALVDHARRPRAVRVRRACGRPGGPAPDVEPLRSCTIITTQATASLREVHDRMPVILPAGRRGGLARPRHDRRTRCAELLRAVRARPRASRSARRSTTPATTPPTASSPSTPAPTSPRPRRCSEHRARYGARRASRAADREPDLGRRQGPAAAPGGAGAARRARRRASHRADARPRSTRAS